MNKVQYGPWKIDVDIEKTKEYYKKYKLSTSQSNRNFQKYCKMLSVEERSFFESLGITPECCDVDPTLGVTKDKRSPCGGYYIVCGRYIENPPENLITIEELVENDFIDNRPDNRIYIGAFQFNFQCEDYEIKNIPEDMPEGFICIRFWCENMRWLLKEKPQEIFYEHLPKFWEIGRIINYVIASKKAKKQHISETKNSAESLFDDLGVVYSKMKSAEVTKYRHEWVREFTPNDADKETKNKIKEVCFSSKKFSTYLWQIFSWEFLKVEENARELFDDIQKSECTIIFDYESVGYRVSKSEKISAKAFERFDSTDIIITADDFSWTYCISHECYLGPYFYRKKNDNL